MGLSLDAFKPRTVTVRIVEEQGGDEVELLTVDLAALTYADMVTIDLALPLPEAPLVKVVKDSKIAYEPATSGAEFEAYQREVNTQVLERNKRRLVTALIKAGNLSEIADKPIEEQVKALDAFDKLYLDRLMDAMVQMYIRGRARVDSLAERFPRAAGAGADHEDLPTKRLEPAGMAAANGRGA